MGASTEEATLADSTIVAEKLMRLLS